MPMINLPGYHPFELLHSKPSKQIYRAFSDSYCHSVILKVVETHSFQDTSKLLQEFHIAQQLDTVGIVRPFAVNNHEGYTVLVLEDTGGISLRSFQQQSPISVPQFLSIAIQMASILGEIHEQNIVHLDIKPDNFIIEPTSLQIKLTDFSSAIREASKFLVNLQEQPLEGSPAYMSPEQTGRMNHNLDYRSDYYSLGVTFYELAYGTLPFTATTSTEWIHAHLSKTPAPLKEAASYVPAMISDIIMKLLEKNPQNRYQGALGLLADLKACQGYLNDIGDIPIFALAAKDAPRTLQHSHTRFSLRLRASTKAADASHIAEIALESSKSEPALREPLTERELEVLSLIAAGLSNRDIAAHLHIAVGTVKVHAKKIFAKLNVNKRVTAVNQAKELNLL